MNVSDLVKWEVSWSRNLSADLCWRQHKISMTSAIFSSMMTNPLSIAWTCFSTHILILILDLLWILSFLQYWDYEDEKCRGKKRGTALVLVNLSIAMYNCTDGRDDPIKMFDILGIAILMAPRIHVIWKVEMFPMNWVTSLTFVLSLSLLLMIYFEL